MGSPDDDLRRVLDRMRERLGKASGPAAPATEETPGLAAEKPKQVAAAPQPAGAASKPAAVTPRLFREDAPPPRSATVEEPAQGHGDRACGGLLRGLAARLFGAGGGASSRELKALEARLALIERRVDALALSGGGRSVPGGLAEEIHELRAMVKALFKALEDPALKDAQGEPDAIRDEA